MSSEVACSSDEVNASDDSSSDDTDELDDRYESLWQVPEEVQVCAFALILSHAFSGGFVFAAHLIIVPRYFHSSPEIGGFISVLPTCASGITAFVFSFHSIPGSLNSFPSLQLSVFFSSALLAVMCSPMIGSISDTLAMSIFIPIMLLIGCFQTCLEVKLSAFLAEQLSGNSPKLFASISEGLPNAMSTLLFGVSLPLCAYLESIGRSWLAYLFSSIVCLLVVILLGTVSVRTNSSTSGSLPAMNTSRLVYSLPFSLLLFLESMLHGITDGGLLVYATVYLQWKVTIAATVISVHSYAIAALSLVLANWGVMSWTITRVSLVSYVTSAVFCLLFVFAVNVTEDKHQQSYALVSLLVVTLLPSAALDCTSWSACVMAYNKLKPSCDAEELEKYESLLQFISSLGTAVGVSLCYLHGRAYVSAVLLDAVLILACCVPIVFFSNGARKGRRHASQIKYIEQAGNKQVRYGTM
jgi:hypothetical protein